MEPGKVFTHNELKWQFNFLTDSGVERFLDMLEAVNVKEFRVITLMDERVLVFESQYWDQFVEFMRSMGHYRDSDA